MHEAFEIRQNGQREQGSGFQAVSFPWTIDREGKASCILTAVIEDYGGRRGYVWK